MIKGQQMSAHGALVDERSQGLSLVLIAAMFGGEIVRKRVGISMMDDHLHVQIEHKEADCMAG
jgi:hypothetical protein